MFNRPVSRVKTSVLDATSAVAAASDSVLARQENGRHTVSITAKGGTVYIGGADVSAENGMPVEDGATVTIPVESTTTDNLYVVGGSVILTEYF